VNTTGLRSARPKPTLGGTTHEQQIRLQDRHPPQIPDGGRRHRRRRYVGAPAVQAQQGAITMRWQSTWPSKDIFHEYANDFAKKVNDMTGGDLKIEVLPAGAVVPAFQLLDAVSKGVLDGGHGVLVYHYGKQTALALWGSGPAYGMDANMLLSWHKYGGGKELLNEIFTSIGANVVSFPYGPMPTQPLGWYKRPITKVDDFKGLKFRTVGISIDVFTGMGAAVNALPGGEIVAAMDRGLLDAGRVQQRDVGPHPRLCRRLQGLDAAELSSERRAVRDFVQ
jgi:TRAP-type mannitol/chloroaromatic compound transport system substrate-binding protein